MNAGTPPAASPTNKQLARTWDQAFTAACREAKIRHVSGTGYIADDTYLTEVYAIEVRNGPLATHSWSISIKPLLVDDILWAVFLPDTDLGGPRARLNHRIAGAFSATSQEIARGHRPLPLDTDPRPVLDALLDEFTTTRDIFIAAYPTVTDFYQRVRGAHYGRARLLEVLTLLAIDDYRNAKKAISAAIDYGDLVFSTAGRDGSVFHDLDRYCDHLRAGGTMEQFNRNDRDR